MEIILIAGGREFTDSFTEEDMFNELEFLFDKVEFRPIILNGAAKGVDQFSSKWARFKGYDVIEESADWKSHGKRAGPIRNQKMFDDHFPKAAIIFPGGSGTAHMRSVIVDSKLYSERKVTKYNDDGTEQYTYYIYERGV